MAAKDTVLQEADSTTTQSAGELSLVDALAAVPAFEGSSREQIEWFASQSEELRLPAGALLSKAGEPADWMVVILEGEIQARRNDDPQSPSLYIARKGQVTGVLPYSRMVVFQSTVYVVGDTRLLRFPRKLFPELMERLPELTQRLVGMLNDRVRETARTETEREKLSALGKLSAGLAHELNNPAAAVRQAISGLREAFRQLEEANAQLRKVRFSDEHFAGLARFEEGLVAGLKEFEPLDELERSDRESELEAWLDKHGVENPWELAPGLAEAGVSRSAVDAAALKISGEALTWGLRHAVAHIEVARILRDAERASTRISELIKSVKEYTYMDQGGEQEIDVHAGLQNTLAMFQYRLKHGVTVIRKYDETAPKVCGFGSELNQVWTNLIDNALDAMQEKGELTVRTEREPLNVLVEIQDNGPGIPANVIDRIFEPFFTTKGVGKGTGLGLDTVYRIVRKHRGDIRVQSQPGRTLFQVRLPIPTIKADTEKT